MARASHWSGAEGCDCFVWVWGLFLTQKLDNFTNSFLDAFLLCLPPETATFDHVLRSCMLPCKLRNYFQVYFFSLTKLRGLCSKYPGIRYLWSPSHFVSWKHKSPFCLITLVGLNQWFEKELNVCSTTHQTDEGTFSKGGQGHHWACSHHLQALLNVSASNIFLSFSAFSKGPQLPFRGRMWRGSGCFCKPEVKVGTRSIGSVCIIKLSEKGTELGIWRWKYCKWREEI